MSAPPATRPGRVRRRTAGPSPAAWAGLLTLLGSLALLWVSLTLGPASAELPAEQLRVGDRVLSVEIAATPESMSRGLMFREHLPDDQGMLFVWPRDQAVAMWMKNTLIPLSVAFIDRDFRILNIADMEPHSLQTHPSHGTARYALEVNQGWFARHGIGPGDRIEDIGRLVEYLPGNSR